MKKDTRSKKLVIDQETIRALSKAELASVAGRADSGDAVCMIANGQQVPMAGP